MPLDDQPVIIDDDPSPEEEKLEEDMKPLIVPEKIPKLDERSVAHVQLVWSN